MDESGRGRRGSRIRRGVGTTVGVACIALLALAGGLAGLAGPASAALPAAGAPDSALLRIEAGSTHRAGVIVDLGNGTVTRTVVTFTSTSITGMQALALAGTDPVLQTYSGQGGAVCALDGVGRAAGSGCLGGTDGDARYWTYFRAAPGATKFTYSAVGAGATRVVDGGVEAWRWGTGSAPAFVSFATLTGAEVPTAQSASNPAATNPTLPPPPSGGAPGNAAPTMSVAPTVPPGLSGTQPGTAPPGPGVSSATTAPKTTATTPGAGSPSSSELSAAAGTSSRTRGSKRSPSSKAVGATKGSASGGSGSAVGVIVIVVVVALAIAVAVALRRRRRQGSPAALGFTRRR